MPRLLMVLLALLAATPGWAAAAQVIVVLSAASGAYSQVAHALQARLARGAAGVTVKTVSASGWGRYAEKHGAPALLVPVGLRAAQAVTERGAAAPILNLLLPRQAFETLMAARPRKDYETFSAIYLDQPFRRQLDLVRFALPGRAKIGVLLGPASQRSLDLLRGAAGKQGLSIRYEQVRSGAGLVPVLRKLLEESDVLLALPDPLVFNRDTIQGVLFTSYRFQEPVIAFSPAYVRAGALAAVYTTPEQFGVQAAQLIGRMAASGNWRLPPPRYPAYFAVSVNHQVAHFLGLTLGSEAALYGKLRQAAEQKQ